jgi:hypothetical protein
MNYMLVSQSINLNTYRTHVHLISVFGDTGTLRQAKLKRIISYMSQ